MKKSKRILPLLASVALISGPVLAVIGCNSEITRYPAALPNNDQNRILFSFVGVNYNVDAKSQFSAAYAQEMDFIKKEVEGIMAKQKFENIFVQKLDYTETNAKETFEKIKDNIGLNILAADYFNTINSGQNFDNKVYQNKLIFQTENWHQFGTIRFDYSKVDFYNAINPDTSLANDPDTIFTPGILYANLNDSNLDKQIKEIAKHPEERNPQTGVPNFQNDLPILTKEKLKWDSPTTPMQLPQNLGTGSIQDYQKKLDRFKWWLRFRYQQYYQSNILPQLNETLFTMANIFDSILNITRGQNNNPEILIDNTKYAVQLQEWGTNSTWKSKYRWVWEYTTDQTTAENINSGWSTNPLADLITTDSNSNPILNSAFFTQLAGTDASLKNTVDPVLGANGYINNTSGKPYDSAVKSDNISQWAQNPDNTGYYWGQNNKGTFAYYAPVYWIDVVQNLNFNYYNDPSNPLLITRDYKKWIEAWNNTQNGNTSNSLFSKYIRADNMPSDTTSAEYKNLQEMKWNTLWEMIYFLSSQEDVNSNKEIAQDNFNTAAKNLFPEFIKKENIFNNDFWQAVKSYY